MSSLLVILLVNPGIAGTSDTQMTGVYEESTTVSPYEASNAWAAESDEESEYQEQKESEYQEQSEEATEEEGSGYENAPSDEEHGFSNEESSDEESMHMTPQEEDDLAHAARSDK
jgi:hypothetical protein